MSLNETNLDEEYICVHLRDLPHLRVQRATSVTPGGKPVHHTELVRHQCLPQRLFQICGCGHDYHVLRWLVIPPVATRIVAVGVLSRSLRGCAARVLRTGDVGIRVEYL